MQRNLWTFLVGATILPSQCAPAIRSVLPLYTSSVEMTLQIKKRCFLCVKDTHNNIMKHYVAHLSRGGRQSRSRGAGTALHHPAGAGVR